jgi:chromosomal replication initiation ATPase DnaA
MAAAAEDRIARREIALLRRKIAELEGRATVRVLPPGERFADIVTACAAEWGVPRELLLGESREAPVVMARFAAMALGRRLLGYSFPRIGRLLARDHSTVMHGVRRMARMAEDDTDLAARLDRLAASFTRKQQRSRA